MSSPIFFDAILWAGMLLGRLPWLVVAIVGFMAYARSRNGATLTQAIGASVLVLGLLLELGFRLMTMSGIWTVSPGVIFMTYRVAAMALGATGTLLIAIGFCVEKLRARKQSPQPAFPVQAR